MSNRPNQTRREFLKRGTKGGAALAALPLGSVFAPKAPPGEASGKPRERLAGMVRKYGGEFGEVGKEA